MKSNNRSQTIKKVSVIGLGKLGLPIAACFARKGHKVVGVDLDSRTICLVNKSRASVFEPGLEDIIKTSRNKLSATDDCEKAVFESNITFIIVPTPSDRKGRFSLKYVLSVCEKVGCALRRKKDYHLVVLTSTVMPGDTSGRVRAALESGAGKKCGKDFGLCYSPEFFALGNIIHDFLNPDFVLIGESDFRAGDLLASFYATICENQPPIARMSTVNAEITKLAVNTYITAKITFANLLARICEHLPGADVDAVTGALGLDKRIGHKYLKGAVGYGGPCFPRDIKALSLLTRQLGIPATLPEAIDEVNQYQAVYLAGFIRSKLPPGGVVGILGLTYKPNTDVVEESQSLLLAHILVRNGFTVTVYDPAGMKNAEKILKGKVRFLKSAEDCIKISDLIVILTPWEEFRNLSPRVFVRSGKQRILVDCWRLLPTGKYRNATEYIPLGTGGFFPKNRGKG